MIIPRFRRSFELPPRSWATINPEMYKSNPEVRIILDPLSIQSIPRWSCRKLSSETEAMVYCNTRVFRIFVYFFETRLMRKISTDNSRNL